jgi:serine/threonine-protein kinase PknG
MPGEVLPLLALGLCAEIRGEKPAANLFYEQVSGADDSVVAAHFGRARILLAARDRAGAAEALERVPDASRFRRAARIGMIRSLSAVISVDGRADAPGVEDCDRARTLTEDFGRDEHLNQTAEELELLNAEVTYADAVRESAAAGVSREVRKELEGALRQMSRDARDRDTQIKLVDLANTVRPWTWR